MNANRLGALAGFAGAFIGGVTGYFLATKQLEEKYKKIAEQEIADAKVYYGKLYKTDDYETPAKAAERLIPAEEVTEEQLEQIVEVLRYGQPSDAKPGDPRVISIEEYMEGEAGHAQVTWTFFAGDETLMDETEAIVDDVERMVGKTNLGRFGFRSNDPNVVYIRNNREGVDYEILRSPGTYAAEVLGITPQEQQE